MALRIIRKSSSQSQVELIKGSSEQKPVFSLLFWIDSSESFEAAKKLMQESWLQNQAEILIYKAHSYSEQLRSQLPAMQQSIKLVNESKASSWSARLRTLIQESATDICLFVPFISEQTPALIQELVSLLQQDSSIGMAAPALVNPENHQLLAAGQDFSGSLSSAHELSFEDFYQNYTPEAQSLFYLYQGLPLSCWQKLAQQPLQVGALPLPLAAIRREAYLSLSWADQDWSPAWLAQDLGMSLRQKQYRLFVLPQTLNLPAAASEWLEAGELPAKLLEKWNPLLRQVLFELYRHHGWQQKGHHFTNPSPRIAKIQDYLSQKEALA